MLTAVKVKMAALRPGSEGLLIIICFSVSVHSARYTPLLRTAAGAAYSHITQLLELD